MFPTGKAPSMGAVLTACGLALSAASSAALADGHGAGQAHEEAERALVILTSDSLETQGMALILSNAMQQQGTDLHILLCDAAGELAVEGYASPAAILTPPGHPADQLVPEGLLGMLMGNGASVEVCAIYLPNSPYGQEDLREGVGVASPGDIAQRMRDPAIPVFSF